MLGNLGAKALHAPVLFFEVAATRPASTQTVLMYGHLDKQPEFTGWRSDLGPWTPKYEDGKLVPMSVKVGDKVLYGKYSGTEITLDNEQYLILRESDVLAVVA